MLKIRDHGENKAGIVTIRGSECINDGCFALAGCEPGWISICMIASMLKPIKRIVRCRLRFTGVNVTKQTNNWTTQVPLLHLYADKINDGKLIISYYDVSPLVDTKMRRGIMLKWKAIVRILDVVQIQTMKSNLEQRSFRSSIGIFGRVRIVAICTCEPRPLVAAI
jgi:hypothetical protein